MGSWSLELPALPALAVPREEQQGRDRAGSWGGTKSLQTSSPVALTGHKGSEVAQGQAGHRAHC